MSKKYTEKQIEDHMKNQGLCTPDELRKRLRGKGYSETRIEEELQIGPAIHELLGLMKIYAQKHPEAFWDDNQEISEA